MNTFFACAACYGQSDSAMAAGMNWGIFSLLIIIVLVLGGVAAFFVFLARRASSVAATQGGQMSFNERLHHTGKNSSISKSSASFDHAGSRSAKSSRTLPPRAHACAREKANSRKPGPFAQPRF
jgi:hypothetical protein